VLNSWHLSGTVVRERAFKGLGNTKVDRLCYLDFSRATVNVYAEVVHVPDVFEELRFVDKLPVPTKARVRGCTQVIALGANEVALRVKKSDHAFAPHGPPGALDETSVEVRLHAT
jgi:hypothetical protein